LSHIVTIKTRVTDPAAVTAACQRLGLAMPVQGTARLYGGEVTGLLVQLPGWQYPAVFDSASGTVQFDNFQGAWGEERELHRFLQIYTAEKCRLEARKRGQQVTETVLEDGSIRLQIQEGC